jgi:hypothetical protein
MYTAALTSTTSGFRGFDLVSPSCLPGHFQITFGALTSFSLSNPCLREPELNFFASVLFDVVAGGRRLTLLLTVRSGVLDLLVNGGCSAALFPSFSVAW